jgi:HEPN domain-containing protein
VGFGYKRSDLQKIAQTKLDDAVLLLRYRRYSNAYYLAGYTVEIGLKACIAAQISAETIPEKGFITKVFDHNLKSLVGLAGLAADLAEKEDESDDFAANWAIVNEWKPDFRYESVESTSAQALIEAIRNPKSGVLAWIKTHW